MRVPEGRQKKRILHVNMLKQWHVPGTVSLIAEEVAVKSADETDDIVLWEGNNTECNEHPTIGTQLTPGQREELDQLLHKHKGILSSRPGRTSAAECCIHTDSAKPIRLSPYQLPHAYRDIIKNDLQEM